MACGSLHLVPPPLVRPAYSESRSMTSADCHWLNPFLRLVNQCCSRLNKIYFILKPWKAHCRTSALRYSLCTTGKEFEQFESGHGAFYLWHQNHKNFQQETSTSSMLPYLTRFVKWLVCLFLFPIVKEVNCISGAENRLPSLFLLKVVLSVGWVVRIILRIEINQLYHWWIPAEFMVCCCILSE